jgi:hypothetical protein
MKKSITLILSLIFVFSAMIGVIPATAEGEATLEITHAKLELGNAPYLYFAVNYSDFGSYEGIQLKVTNKKTNNTHIYEPIPDVEAPEGCVAFKYTAINWQEMGDELSVQAMKDGKNCGEAKTYSVLEYALKAQSLGDAALSELMVAMLNYGANMQNVMKHAGTYDLFKTYSLVEVQGGKINKESKIIVERGTKVTASFSDDATSSLTTTDPYHLIKAQ